MHVAFAVWTKFLNERIYSRDLASQQLNVMLLSTLNIAYAPPCPADDMFTEQHDL